jgi:hypothetical protein
MLRHEIDEIVKLGRIIQVILHISSISDWLTGIRESILREDSPRTGTWYRKSSLKYLPIWGLRFTNLQIPQRKLQQALSI